MIFEHQVFRALGLVVKLGSELHVLNHGELCGALELILVRDGVLHADLADLHQHIFTQLVNLLNPVTLDALNERFVRSLLLIDQVLLRFELIERLLLGLSEVHQVLLDGGQLGDLFSLALELRLEVVLQLLH